MPLDVVRRAGVFADMDHVVLRRRDFRATTIQTTINQHRHRNDNEKPGNKSLHALGDQSRHKLLRPILGRKVPRLDLSIPDLLPITSDLRATSNEDVLLDGHGEDTEEGMVGIVTVVISGCL